MERPVTYDRSERQRLATNREKVEALMRDRRWHDGIELMRTGGTRALARLWDMKADGWDYEKRIKAGCRGVYEYKLRPKVIRQPGLFEEAHV